MAHSSDNPKLRVGVIFGGRSGEHEVSLRSARSVMAALDRNKYEVIPIGITKEGQWLAGDAMALLADGKQDAETTSVILPPAPSEQHGLVSADSASTTGNVSGLDVVIPVLHGTYGEDGTVQGLLELAGVPYVGAGVTGSAVGMDKAIFKYVMEANGLPQLPWVLVLTSWWHHDPEAILAMLENELSYPMFVKPANLGSSVGISRCADRDGLKAGLIEASQFDRRIVVEQGANIRELEVAVMGNDQPQASVVGEIRPKRDFYDYEAKYITDDSELLIPAPIDGALAEQIQSMAIAVYMAIDCAGLGRVDLMLDKDSGELYVNEINTLPGFTSISMYPKLWEASGVSYSQLLDYLIEFAVSRNKVKAALKTEK
ncbi:MAG: D-alanine--D-alanine ligase family protein [Anaerolineae bacterium]